MSGRVVSEKRDRLPGAKSEPEGAPPAAPLGDLGAHLSVAGGLERCFERAAELAASTGQIFCKNQRQWKGRPLGDYEVGRFRRAHRNSAVGAVVAHATYLINLASDDKEIRTKSIACLAYELHCSADLGLAAVIVHPGSCSAGPEVGIPRIAAAIEELDRQPPNAGVPLLLESTAGQGNAIGWRLEHLEAIIRALRPRTAERVGICLDTCHLHAAGYDVSDQAAWRALLAEVRERFGLERLGAIHVNDSRTERGSRVDRHANLGEGTMGLESFRGLLAIEELHGVPKILETPEEREGHRRDLETLRSLLPS